MNKAVDFLSRGVSCFAVCLLDKMEIWEKLKQGFNFHHFEKHCHNNRFIAAINSTLGSLLRDKIIKNVRGIYYLTSFGYAIDKQLGLFLMFFDGYRLLIANQEKILREHKKFPEKYIDGQAIAYASIKFSQETSEPIILQEISNLNPKMICDLGCGSGSNLIRICEKLKIKGLGIDRNESALKLGRSLLKHPQLVVLKRENILSSRHSYPDVDILLLDYVMHDFVPEAKCVQMLDSMLDKFPNLKYFFITDIVAPSKKFPSSLPGFDYVHGLLGIKTRTHRENEIVFKKSKYLVHKEIPIKKLPNTFFWILKPKSNMERKKF